MAPWCNIGRRTIIRSVAWLSLSNKSYSSKLPITNSVYREFTIFVEPLLRKLSVPIGKISVNIQYKYVHDGVGSESDSELEETTEIIDLFNEPEFLSFRHILYPDTENPHIRQLNASTTVEDVFNFVREHKNEMDGELVSQSVLVLWDLQKIFYKVNVGQMDELKSEVSSLLNSFEILRKYVTEVYGHPDFDLLLQLVDQYYDGMSLDALTATFLYLSKMGISLHHPVMQNLELHCELMMERCGSNFPLTALSRFSVAVGSDGGLWSTLVSRKTLPNVLTGIETCGSVEDLRLLTICLMNMMQLISSSVLSMYKHKVEELINNGTIQAKDSRIIAKIVKFLNYPFWTQKNNSTIRKLLLILKGNISEISPKDLMAVHKVLQSQLEPADMVDEVQKAISYLLSQLDSEKLTRSPMVFQAAMNLLSCLISFSSPNEKLKLEKMAQYLIDKCRSPGYLPVLFRVLRSLKTSNIQLCDTYWSKMLDHIDSVPEEREDYKLIRNCHRYMYFNNNLGGTYRHYELEKRLIHLLLDEVINGTSGIIPHKFARVAAFILAYGNIGHARSIVPDSTVTFLVSKLSEMSPQFSNLDCLYISRGLQIGKRFDSKSNRVSSFFLEVFLKIDAIMNNCSIQHLKREDITLTDINNLVKSYIWRAGEKDTDLFKQLIERHEDCVGDVSSRYLREAANSYVMTNYLAPNVLDRLANYVVENNQHVMGETIVKLLFACYSLGYSPKMADEFFLHASKMIVRDKDRMQGLLLLQAAIALCFFHHLPEDLIYSIFTVDFLERLDVEVQNCYAKASYPTRVRYAMMQLNRAVCLDYPETDIPWFHEKYCQQLVSLGYSKLDNIYEDVYQSLESVLGSGEFIQKKKYSPYFYEIDFQILLNKDKTPVTVKNQSDSNISRIAVLLRDKAVFTNGVVQLCGEQQLKQRHLEMLGYRVIGISSVHWNSMYMMEPKAKTNYLKDQIWPGSADFNFEKHNL